MSAIKGICPQCKAFKALTVLESETVLTKSLGKLTISAYQCPENHIHYNLAVYSLDGKRIKYFREDQP